MKKILRILLLVLLLFLLSGCYFTTRHQYRMYTVKPECLAAVQYWHGNMIAWNSCNDWIRVYWIVPFPHSKKK